MVVFSSVISKSKVMLQLLEPSCLREVPMASYTFQNTLFPFLSHVYLLFSEHFFFLQWIGKPLSGKHENYEQQNFSQESINTKTQLSFQ